jgi:hypothetical protein
MKSAEDLCLSPSYVRKLCSTGKLGYVVKRWMVKGPNKFYLRRKRFIPWSELLRYKTYQAAEEFVSMLPELIACGDANVRLVQAFLHSERVRAQQRIRQT